MTLLSKKTHVYFEGHQKILANFLTSWKPVITKEFSFGDLTSPIDSTFPSTNHWFETQMTHHKKARLSAVNYKLFNNRYICAIQFVYTTGFHSPMFQTDDALEIDNMYPILLPVDKKIVRIGVKAFFGGSTIKGLAFVDE